MENNATEIGCDSTAVNTGSKHGCISQLKYLIGQPQQWFICQLHTNELPLRHLISKIGGKTSGSNFFTGPIGKSITDDLSLFIAVSANQI